MTADIVSQIKARIDLAAFDLSTAEGRLDFDKALRAELAKITDIWLSRHAAEILKDWRRDLFGGVDHAELHQLRDRIAAIEARLGIEQPRPVGVKRLHQGSADG